MLKVLEAGKFPARYINWIRECISTTSFSISVNGSLCGFFQGEKGLRQGDPLSPPLFILSMEVFSNMLNNQMLVRHIGAYPLCKNPLISHLSFADDVMIFYDGKPDSLAEICKVLEEFEQMSGLGLNKEKTGNLTKGISEGDQLQIEEMGFQTLSLPIRYLGLPLMHRRLSKSDYSPLIDQISKKMNNWKTRCLSFAGRLQLLSAVINSLANFWLTSFLLPKGCLKQISQLCSRFLWQGDISKKHGTKVAWSSVCLPKAEGGLGLKNFFVWNKVLYLKLIWKLCSGSESLWVAWNKRHRMKNTCFWSATISTYNSWIWNNMLSMRQLARQFMRTRLGNGHNTSFWYDHWSPYGPLIDFIGTDGPRKIGISIDKSVHEASLTRFWKLTRVRSPDANIFTLSRYIASIRGQLNANVIDQSLWVLDQNSACSFSSKETWDFLRPSSQALLCYKTIWFKGNVPKHAFHLWVTHLNRLPVRARTSRWDVNRDPKCVLCSVQVETRDHLLLSCDFSKLIWNSMLSRLGCAGMQLLNWDGLMKWLSKRRFVGSRTLCRIVAQATLYSLWHERNSRLHRNTTLSDEALVKKIDRRVRDILLARRTRKNFNDLLSLWFNYE